MLGDGLDVVDDDLRDHVNNRKNHRGDSEAGAGAQMLSEEPQMVVPFLLLSPTGVALVDLTPPTRFEVFSWESLTFTMTATSLVCDDSNLP